MGCEVLSSLDVTVSPAFQRHQVKWTQGKRGAFVSVRRCGHCGPDSWKGCRCNNVHWITDCAGRGKLGTIAFLSRDYGLATEV